MMKSTAAKATFAVAMSAACILGVAGCSAKTKTEAKEAMESAGEAAKETGDAVKSAATDAVDAAKDAAD